ncbi:MAG: CHRD domain-containing protein [Burkholderiaceae bacterium]|nr:CHRD domain-containing protein [Burkholderiaceae bacterium]
MMQTRTFLSLGVVAVALSLGACGSMMASNTVNMSAKLSAANEVPANASPGTGMASASFDKQTNMLSWTVTYSGLTGPVRAGHFHGPAAAGANAGVVQGFSGSMDSPIKGSATLTPAQVADLMAGKWYVNLHTAANPGGEIRGQVMVAQ